MQGGDSSGVLTVTLATPAPAGECSSPAQHRTAGSLHLQDYVHNNVIIIIDWALPAIRKPRAGAGVYRVAVLPVVRVQ